MKRDKWDSYRFTIGDFFLPALINGDYSGLADEDEIAFDDWLRDLNLPANGHWAYESDEESFFAHDEVTKLKAMCVTVWYHFKRK